MLSIIIPIYNNLRGLKKQLESLNMQKLQKNEIFEVVIVDDGSTERIKDYIDTQNLNYRLQYFYLEKNNNSSRSRTRNFGISKSRGNLITLLDAGIIVNQLFVQNTISELSLSENNILLHYTYGLFSQRSETFDSLVDVSLTSENINKIFSFVQSNESWRDVREDIFGKINNLPAAWSLGWTCAYSLSKKNVLAVQGFDENFKNWGGEDSDISLKLQNHGCTFSFVKNACGIHIPHKIEAEDTFKLKSSIHNRNLIFNNTPCIESEIYTILPSQILNQVINMLQNLTVGQMIKDTYHHETLNYIKQLNKNKSSLLVGFTDQHQISLTNASDALIYSKETLNHLNLLDVHFHNFLGLKTPFKDCQFDCVYISDFIRQFPISIIAKIITELNRISKHLYFVYSSNYISTFNQIFNVQVSLESISEKLNSNDFTLFKTFSENNEAIYEVIIDIPGLRGVKNS